MTATLHITPELIERFNVAAGLAREGKFDESLAAWNRLLAPRKKDKNQERVLTGDFLGQAYMRKAWVLMDLGRHEEARQTFEDDVLQACLGQFKLEVLYEYYFSYANTLGNLGEIGPMDAEFSRALHIASQELGDYERCYRCWWNLLAHAEAAEAWDFILGEVGFAIGLAINQGDQSLEHAANLYRAMAMAQVGRKTDARSIVQPLRKHAAANGLANMTERCDEIMKVADS